MRYAAAAASSVLLAFVVAGCSGTNSSSSTPQPPEEPNHVGLYDNYFQGGNRTVAMGTTLTFEDEGNNGHTVTIHHPPDALNLTVKDTALKHGEKTTYTFNLPGTYHVWCKYHGTMTKGMAMVVTVQ